MRILLLLAGVAALSGQALAADVAEMSASDIIKKSEAAYAAVKTYVGTTTVRTKTDAGVMKWDQVSTAKVTFIRPGKVRIEGKSGAFKGSQPYAIISDGKTTWKSWAGQNNGAFSEVQNVGMAGMGGVAQGAAEGIPAALMKSDGGKDPLAFAWMAGSNPFSVTRLSEAKLVGHEKIEDADCYKLVVKHPKLGDVTMWIDSKSFLLRQMTRESNETQLAEQTKSVDETMKKFGKEQPSRKANVPATKSRNVVFSFTIDQVDGPVDAKLFADPTKK
jgi:hypothetical protein